ncbi:MAG: phosphoribosyltransferase family protein [Gemmatimonadaceae bacterium]
MYFSFGNQLPVVFRDRWRAGAALAALLRPYATEPDVVVLGLARGGVVVAREVADALGAPMDVFVARKVGVPGIEEVALCAIAEGTEQVLADKVAWYIGVPASVMRRLSAQERVEIERRVRLYRNGRSLTLHGRTVIVVDDGLATGATMCAAVEAIRLQKPARIVVAVPVATAQGASEVRPYVDAVVIAQEMRAQQTVSSMYARFEQVTDAEVLALLARPPELVPRAIVRDVSARITEGRAYGAGNDGRAERPLSIPVDGGTLLADLGMPSPVRSKGVLDVVDDCAGLVVLVHGGGSSRHSYRNRYIAGRLRLSGYATVRLDLMTADEQERDAEDASLRFDAWRGAARLVAACEWLQRSGFAGARAPFLMGASTGAAAALCAAAILRHRVSGVISRGGRVDLASSVLQYVKAPVLMLVGDRDAMTFARNKAAQRQLTSAARLVRVKRAGHTFEEPGALGAVAEHAVDWLRTLEPHETARVTAPFRVARD